MRHVCFRVAVASLALARPVAAQSPLDSASLGAWLDSLVPRALQDGDIAGAVVVIVKDGRILVQRGYGFADLQRKIAMDPRETVIPVGSVSKLFTWTAVMQQVQLGKLDLMDATTAEIVGAKLDRFTPSAGTDYSSWPEVTDCWFHRPRPGSEASAATARPT